MPAYFTMEIERSKKHIPKDYVAQLYGTIIEQGFSFDRGDYSNKQLSYKEIVEINQKHLKYRKKKIWSRSMKHRILKWRLKRGGIIPSSFTGTARKSKPDRERRVQVFFTSPYSEFRGFFGYYNKVVCFLLIIPEDDVLDYVKGDLVMRAERFAPIYDLAIAIWEKGLADAIQTEVEQDGGIPSLKGVLMGKELSVRPFAIVDSKTLARFEDETFRDMVVREIGNDGRLISCGERMGALWWNYEGPATQ